MKSFIKTIILSGSLVAALSLSAQNTYSGYFLDNYDYRFEMNPAFGNENKAFFSFPVLGNMNLGINGNLNLSDVIYNVNGKTCLFTNPGVSVEEAMSKFGEKNRLSANERFDILTAGFKAFGGYNTVSISAFANLDASLPGSFFSLAKEGITNKSYDITNLRASANAYAQIALNHSRDIKQVPGLRVGAALKFLVGVGALDMQLDEANLTLGENSWTARTNANIYASVTGLTYDHETYTPKGNKGGSEYEYVSGANIDGFSLNGFGIAFDLGAQYEWNDFKFSFAALDLGFINWGKTQWASTNGTQEISTDAYTFNTNGDADNSFDNELDNLKDDLAKLYQLQDNGEKSSYCRSLAATLNFGVDYELPVYRKLHFGLLNTTKIHGPFTTTDFRLSANVAPVKVVSANVNVCAGTYGVGFGWLLNVHAPGFNIFFGMDRTVGKLSKQLIPINSNANFNFGINFPL